MSTQHDRLIQAGAPCLLDYRMYEVRLSPRNGQFVIFVDVVNEVNGDLYALVERICKCPAVSDIVDMAREAAGRSHPESALSIPVRELVFGPH